MIYSVPSSQPSLLGRFTTIMAGVYQAVAASIAQNRNSAPMIVLICRRLSRIVVRFTRLANRASAGTLPQPRARNPRRRKPADPARPSRPPSPEGLPDDWAWLIRLVPAVAGYRGQLRHLLSDPEMVALIAAVPQFGRILRPLCRALSVKPEPPLPPPPARRARSQASAETPAEPAGAEMTSQRPERRRGGFAGLPPPEPA